MVRAGRLYIAILVACLAVVGAALHPVVFLLSLAPAYVGGVDSWLSNAKSVIADVLGWGLVSLFAVMGVLILLGRSKRRSTRASGKLRLPVSGERPGVVVAITAYNDAEATARAVRDFMCQDGVIEVLVIDNNSSDGTARLAAAAGASVIHEGQQGYGYACIRGLKEASRVLGAEVIVLTEGDGTFVAEDLPKFLAYIGQSDMVIGTRVVRGLVENGSQMDYFFTWGNMAVAALLRLRFWDSQFLGAARLSDVGCTYRAIRRDALERILPDLILGGNEFSAHMMLVALARGLSLVEIPITFRRRIGHSKGASQSLAKGLQVGIAMIWHILTYHPRRANNKPVVLPLPAAEVVSLPVPEGARTGP